MNAILTLAWALGVAQPVPSRDEHHYDFRKPDLSEDLLLLTSRIEEYVRSEPEGLRITLPRERKEVAPIVGVRRSVLIKGDFEVTATVEILEAEVPAVGFGVGVSLFVQKAPPSPEGAGIYRLVRSGGEQVIYWDRSIGQKGEKPRFQGGAAPCAETRLRMRLKRVGTMLRYLWAAGTEGEDFQQISEIDFGPDDIQGLSVRGTTGKQPYLLDARVLELRIRGVQPGGPGGMAPPQDVAIPPPKKSTLVCILAAALVAVVAATLGVRHVLRRSGAT